jgi:hypothetical protein
MQDLHNWGNRSLEMGNEFSRIIVDEVKGGKNGDYDFYRMLSGKWEMEK